MSSIPRARRGRPKGVAVTHGNAVNFIGAMDRALGASPNSDDPGAWLAITNFTFDISFLELIWTLVRGFKLVIQSTGSGAMFASALQFRQRKIDFSLFYFADEETDQADKYRLLKDGARFADRNGFSAVWTPERHFHSFGGLYPNPSVASAALATITQKIQIRAGSVVLPLHDPVRVAEEWSLVDNLSGGRVGISVASGWNATDFVFNPKGFSENKELMYRNLATVRALWRGETLSLPGGDGPASISIRPRPVQPELPIWITAAGNPDTFKTAGRLGANLLTHLLGQSIEELAEKIAIYRQTRREHGHSGDGQVTLMLHTFIGKDMARVRDTVEQPFRQYLSSSLGLMKGLARSLGLDMDSEHFTEAARDTLLTHAFDRYFENGALFGAPDHCLKKIDDLKGIGVDEIGCLIDFGVDYATTMTGLEDLNELRQRATAGGDEAHGDYAFAAQMANHRVTHLQATPSTLRLLLADDRIRRSLGSLKYCLLGGEALPPSLAREIRGLTDAEILNMYGPTETTIWSTLQHPIGEDVTIGRPIANTRVYIADKALNPRAIGLSGELLIAGRGVARGYWRRPELTAQRFIPDPFSGRAGERLYRTGDLACWRGDGEIDFLGRFDHQVKLRGHRIEPGEIEAALARHPDVGETVVMADTDKLTAYFIGTGASAPDLHAWLADRLPAYMIPAHFIQLEKFPLMASGKLNRRKLAALGSSTTISSGRRAPGQEPETVLEKNIAEVWRDVLKLEKVGLDDSFFELGGHSILLAQAHRKLQNIANLSMVDLFRFPTIRGLAGHLANSGDAPVEPRKKTRVIPSPHLRQTTQNQEIAVIGMACRFPGASSPDEFWRNLYSGKESITFFSDQELLDAGVHPALVHDPNYVKASPTLDDIDLFDAEFFGFSPGEAALLDPQHRFFLECSWEALEHAACDPDRFPGRIGVFAGSGMNTYLLNNLHGRGANMADERFQLMIANDKDFLPSRAAYALNLTGPALAVQTGCSTSLVAIDLACRYLRAGQCEMALAGAASIRVPRTEGYLYQPGMIASPDGHCRAFDAEARGTLFGSGVGVVALKPLNAALADGDLIHAIIKGSAVNNDGADKIGYTAPGVAGQTSVIRAALEQAGVAARDIGYIEAHGTGTELGDPIEIEALSLAFGQDAGSDRRAIGSVKSNFGHLDTASGVAGFIKTVLSLQHKQIPPSLHYQKPNPEIDFENSPFYVNSAPRDWASGPEPRRAGVSSFGIGGVNAHVILQEAPELLNEARPVARTLPLALSARSPEALDRMTANLAAYWRERPDFALADVAFTLQTGRKPFAYRRSLVCSDREEALAKLEAPQTAGVATAVVEQTDRPVVFMFPGGGAQYRDMGRGLYEREPVFRQTVDRCATLLKPLLNGDLVPMIYGDEPETGSRIKETSLALPALFTIEYAAAQLLISWGVAPTAMIGHSMGEYVAACLADVFSLEDALALVVERARLFEKLPRGGMVSVPLPADRVRDLLHEELCFAAVNGPGECVVSGPVSAIEAFMARLDQYQIEHRRLQINVAAHSRMVGGIVAEFIQFVAKRRPRAPKTPFISNVTGTWITAEQAADPAFWGRQLRETVQFGAGVETLSANPEFMFLELGPGRSLTTLVRLQTDRDRVILPSIRHPYDKVDDHVFLLETLGKLWTAGLTVDWPRLHGDDQPRRLVLPAYPFDRKRHWIEPSNAKLGTAYRPEGKNPHIDDWFYIPSWRTTPNPSFIDGDRFHGSREGWLIFDDGELGLELAARLVEFGHDVTIAGMGENFEAGPHFTLRPNEPEDYASLCRTLLERGEFPAKIIHLWSFGEFAEDKAPDAGYFSLLFLAQALAESGVERRLELNIVGQGLFPVESGDLVYPERAVLLGPRGVLSQEYAHIACKTIDLPVKNDPSTPFALMVETLLAETVAPPENESIAYRGCRRLVLEYTNAPIARETKPVAALREAGVYLITGGLGGVGMRLADFLARAYRARLVLIGRSAFPAEQDWESYNDTSDPITQKIAIFRQWQELGAQVMVLSADVADRDGLQAAMRLADQRFGPPNGVIHAAGLAGVETVKIIPDIDRSESERQFRAKIDGARNFGRLLKNASPDFVLLISSNVTVLGGLGAAAYTAANSYLDAHAAQMWARGKRWISACWDGWLSPSDTTARTFQTSIDQYAMLPEESVEAFRRLVGAARSPRIIVSTGDLEARLDLWVRGRKTEAPATTARPALGTECVAPETELQERIVAIWRETLSIDVLGIHDNFFELGGNSLIALKVIARLKKELGVEIPVVTLFEGPTVSAFAELLSTPESERESGEQSRERGQRRRSRRRKRGAGVNG